MYHIITSQVYPPPQTQENTHQVFQLQNNFNQPGNGSRDQSSQMETDERSTQSQVVNRQQDKSNIVYNKEWIDRSVEEGYIRCYSGSDIKVGRPIATGSYGVVSKATMTHTGIPVAMKTLVWRPDECEERLYKKFAKEVCFSFDSYCMLFHCYRFL